MVIQDPIIELKDAKFKKNQPIIEKLDQFDKLIKELNKKLQRFLINFFYKELHYLNDCQLLIVGI